MSFRKIFCIGIIITMITSLLPAAVRAEEPEEDYTPEEEYIFSEEDFSVLDNDVFAMIREAEEDYAAEIILDEAPVPEEAETTPETDLVDEDSAEPETEPVVEDSAEPADENTVVEDDAAEDEPVSEEETVVEEPFAEPETEEPDLEVPESDIQGDVSILAEQDYVDMLPEIIEVIENSETYVEGTLQQNGCFLVWETTTGIPCCFDPSEEAVTNNPEAEYEEDDGSDLEELIEQMQSAPVMAKAPDNMEIGLVMPYYDSEEYYHEKANRETGAAFQVAWETLCSATGSSGNYRYTMENATLDNLAATIENCGLVLIHSHGSTDYNSGSGDLFSKANTSYLCLTTTSGLSTSDIQRHYGEFGSYFDLIYGGGKAYVNGDVITRHMTKSAPSSFVYLGACLSMTTDGLCTPLLNNGVEALFGFSRVIRTTGNRRFMASITSSLKHGDSLAYAVSAAKEEIGHWYAGLNVTCTFEEALEREAPFPIVVSSEDPYPGRENVQNYQEVRSSWKLDPTKLDFTGTVTVDSTAFVNSEITPVFSGNAAYFAESELSYQWMKYSGTGMVTNISGATEKTFVPNSDYANTTICLKVNAEGFSQPIYSNNCYISRAVVLSAANFPDTAFRNYLSATYDTDQSGSLDLIEEISKIKTINVSGTNVASLTGLRYLIYVNGINASNSQITDFDGTGVRLLRTLNLSGCPVNSINLDANNNLEYLYMQNANGSLSSLDVSGHRDL